MRPEVLSIAGEKDYPEGTVRFVEGDAYRLDRIEGEFDAAFAGFWWSHLPLSRPDRFLEQLNRRIGVGARVLFLDNRYVAGSSTPIAEIDSEQNSYQLRRLRNGSEYLVLKNFPDEADLRLCAGHHGKNVEVTLLTYYWCLTYQVERRCSRRSRPKTL